MRSLVWLLLGLNWSALAHAANFVMPKDLVQYAEANGCAQVGNFFDRAGSVNPPYIYTDAEVDDNAILWCKKPEPGTEKPYVLLLKGAVAFAKSCATRIEWWNVPGGLTIRKLRSLDMRDFQYVDRSKKRGPSTKQTGSAIVSSYDGVETIFYCYQGNWLYTIKH